MGPPYLLELPPRILEALAARGQGPAKSKQDDDRQTTSSNSSSGDGGQILVAKPKDPSHLFDLAQEIQDEVFEYAYPRMDSNRKIIRKSNWEGHQVSLKRRDANYQPQPFSPKVNEFLISKRFFFSAVRAYVGNQVFDELSDGGLFESFATNMKVSSHRACSPEWRSRLQVLEVTVTPETVGFTLIHLVINTVMDDGQLKGCSFFRQMVAEVSGLRSLKLKADGCLKGDPRSSIWADNVRNLEALLAHVVTQPKKVDQDIQEMTIQAARMGRPMRLYLGSNNFFDSCKSVDDNLDPFWYVYDSPVVKVALEKTSTSAFPGYVPVAKKPRDGDPMTATMDSSTGDRESNVKSETNDVDLAELVLKRATVDPGRPQVRSENIPETDDEIMKLIVSNPAGILAYVRESKDRELERTKQKEQKISVSEILGKLGLD